MAPSSRQCHDSQVSVELWSASALNFRMNPLSNYTRIFNYGFIERKTPLTCHVNGSLHPKRQRNAEDWLRTTSNEFLLPQKTALTIRDNYFIRTYGLYHSLWLRLCLWYLVPPVSQMLLSGYQLLVFLLFFIFDWEWHLSPPQIT